MKNVELKFAPASLLAAMLIAGIVGCVGPSEWTCRRSSECPERQFCRVGQCVPAVGFVPDPASPGYGADAGWTGNADAGWTGNADAALIAEGCPEGSAPAVGELVINEVLANVPADKAGDANADGARDAYEDEFVELVNTSDHILDISGVTLRVGEHEKFKFGATCLESGQAAVIFGGGHPAPQASYLVRVGQSSLGLSNGGGNISLYDAQGAVLSSMAYSDAAPESLTLSPQLVGEQFVPHTTLSPEQLFSPGVCPNGQQFSEGCVENGA
jgi:hypothetical protein